MSKTAKTIGIIIALVVIFIPVEIYITARYAFEPEGFWQEIVLFGLGVWFLGVIQIVFLFFGFFFVVPGILRQ